jgi:hypothetical protein
MSRTYITHWVKRNAYWILVCQPDEKKAPQKPRYRWNDNKMDFR